jgi:competence protein ComEC
MENEDGAETDLLEYWGDDALKADVLKVGHHGSSTSTSYRFLRAVAPAYAVISVGENNKHKHPNKETMDILGQAEVYVYRTDYMGTIIAVSDGTSISFGWTKDDADPYIPDAK